MIWVLALLGAVFGALAGVAMRIVLCRLPRGTPVRPPLCEVAVAVLWSAAALGWAASRVPSQWVPVLLGLGWLGVAVTVVDLRHHRIPDALTVPALPSALVCAVPLGGAALLRALVGAVLAVAVHWVVHAASPRSMGAGDVKLAAALGAVLAAAGWLALPLGAVLAALLTVTIGLAEILRRRVLVPARSPLAAAVPERRTGVSLRAWPVPHGPSMVWATVLITAYFATAGTIGQS